MQFFIYLKRNKIIFQVLSRFSVECGLLNRLTTALFVKERCISSESKGHLSLKDCYAIKWKYADNELQSKFV